MVVYGAAREALLERARAVIASVEATLAEPRPRGPLWAGAPLEPEPVRKGTREALPVGRRKAVAAISAHQSTRLAMAAVGKVLREALAERDAKIANLEARLASLEAKEKAR